VESGEQPLDDGVREGEEARRRGALHEASQNHQRPLGGSRHGHIADYIKQPRHKQREGSARASGVERTQEMSTARLMRTLPNVYVQREAGREHNRIST
jgi:hypothetical protein